MVTYNDNIVTNFLVGQDELIPHIKKAYSYGSEFQKNFDKGININKGTSKLLNRFLPDSEFTGRFKKGLSDAFGRTADIKSFDKNMFAKITSDTQFYRRMESLGETYQKNINKGIDMGRMLKRLNTQFGEGSIAMKAFNVGQKTVTDRMENAKKKAAELAAKQEELKKRFDMNILSWVFGGMALRNMGMTMMRFLIPPMDKLEQLQTNAAKKTMAVGAAFEFLKISLFETLSNTPMFQEFVEWLVKAAIWVSEFVQKHPIVVQMAAVLAGIAVTLGSLAMAVGIIGQLEHLTTLLGGVKLAAAFLMTPLGVGAALFSIMGLATLSFDDTRSALSDIFKLVTNGAVDIGNAFLDLFGFEGRFTDFWHLIGEIGIRVFSALGFTILEVGKMIYAAFTGIQRIILRTFQIIAEGETWFGLPGSEERLAKVNKALSENQRGWDDVSTNLKNSQDKLIDISINGLDSQYLSLNKNVLTYNDYASSVERAAQAQERFNSALNQQSQQNNTFNPIIRNMSQQQGFSNPYASSVTEDR